MKSYEVIKLACLFSEQDKLADKLIEENIGFQFEEKFNQKEKDILKIYLNCLNLVQEEIATEYQLLLYEETVKTENLKFVYSWSFKPLYKIISIKDLKGRAIKYKALADHALVFAKDVIINYAYYPQKLENLESELEIKIPERIIAYGVAREYYLKQGLHDDAYVFENRFKDGLKVILRRKSEINLPGRRWF